jgi:hypothetical protein
MRLAIVDLIKKGFWIVSKVVKVLSIALILVLVFILVLSFTGAVFAHNGNGAGDGTGTYADCPDDCGNCSDCTHEPHLWGGPGPHPAYH